MKDKRWLLQIVKEGALVSSDGTWHEKVNSAAPKVNRVIEVMKNTDEIARIIYPNFVRPYLKFASSVWNPLKDIRSVQHRATLTKESHQKRLSFVRLVLRKKTRNTRFDRAKNSEKEAIS